MRYFKYIDINNCQTVLKKSRDFVSEVYAIQIEKQESLFQAFNWKSYISYCPEILTAFSKYDLEPFGGFIYILFTQSKAPIHVDVISKRVNQCRINIPIFNCEYSRTFYYSKIDGISPTEGPVFYETNTGIVSSRYIRYQDNDPTLQKVDEVVLNKPTVMRVQEPHRVIIDPIQVPRVALTIRTRKDPVYLLEEVEHETC